MVNSNVGWQRTSFCSRNVSRILWILFFIFVFWNIGEIRNRTNLISNLLVSQQIKIESNFSNKGNSSKPSGFILENVECYKFSHKNTTPIKFLDDIMDSPRKPTNGKSIFFIEASCSTDGRVNIHPKQACAIESAAKANSNSDIFVLFVTPVGFGKNGSELPPILQALQSYPNIYLRNLNITKAVANTPAEKWIPSGELFKSKYLSVHMSDFLRLVVLFHFGGTYMDLDYIIIKSIEELQPNYFGKEDKDITGNSVISFQHNSIGHEIVRILLQEFTEKYAPQEWSYNGPDLMRRTAARICGTHNYKEQTRERCIAFELVPPHYFYPLPGYEWDLMFMNNKSTYLLNKFNNSYGIHTWNSHRHDRRVDNEPNSAFSVLGRKYCPKASAVGEKDF